MKDALSSASNEEAAFHGELLRRYLLSRCRFLEAWGPNDAGARAAARETWERDVLEAEAFKVRRDRTQAPDAGAPDAPPAGESPPPPKDGPR